MSNLSNFYKCFMPVSLMILSINCSSCLNKYKQLPKSYRDPDVLIKSVHPDKNYTYWEFCGWPSDVDTVIFRSGKKPNNIKFHPPLFQGLFRGCLPAMCYKYINYVYNGKVGYVTDPKEFKDFLESIDNLEEAVLLAETSEELSIDDDNSKGGSYFNNNEGYNLRLMQYNSCPETKESIYLQIKKDKGIVKKSDLGAYYKSKECIEY